MISSKTYEAIKAGKIIELRTSTGGRAYGLRISDAGNITGVIAGSTGAFWYGNGKQIFPYTQSGIGDLLDETVSPPKPPQSKFYRERDCVLLGDPRNKISKIVSWFQKLMGKKNDN